MYVYFLWMSSPTVFVALPGFIASVSFPSFKLQLCATDNKIKPFPKQFCAAGLLRKKKIKKENSFCIIALHIELPWGGQARPPQCHPALLAPPSSVPAGPGGLHLPIFLPPGGQGKQKLTSSSSMTGFQKSEGSGEDKQPSLGEDSLKVYSKSAVISDRFALTSASYSADFVLFFLKQNFASFTSTDWEERGLFQLPSGYSASLQARLGKTAWHHLFLEGKEQKEMMENSNNQKKRGSKT